MISTPSSRSKTQDQKSLCQEDDLIKDYLNGIILGDCKKEIKNLPDESVHLIISDIPYGIGIDSWDILHNNTNAAFMGTSPAQQKIGTLFKRRGKPINGWSEADRQIPQQYYDWCYEWAGEWLRVLKPGGSAFVFAGRRFAHRCILALEDRQFSYKDCIAWLKSHAPHRAQRVSLVYERRGNSKSAIDWEGWRVGNLRPLFEPIQWFMKPYKIGGTLADNILEYGVGAYNQRAFNRYTNSAHNIIKTSALKSEMGLHPTQKPISLMQALIELTTKKDQIVLDPFAGSGTALVAARRLGRQFIGYEINKDYFEAAQKRLRSEDRDLLSRII